MGDSQHRLRQTEQTGVKQYVPHLCLQRGEIITQECLGGRFCKWRATGPCPPKKIEKYTLNSAFWRNIYTKLRKQAISQVEISLPISKKDPLESGPFCLLTHPTHPPPPPRYGPVYHVSEKNCGSKSKSSL